jgi:hypothetical protein
MDTSQLSSGLQKKGGKDLFACRKGTKKDAKPDCRKSLIAHIPHLSTTDEGEGAHTSFEALLRAGVRLMGVPLSVPEMGAPLSVAEIMPLEASSEAQVPPTGVVAASNVGKRQPDDRSFQSMQGLFKRVCNYADKNPDIKQVVEKRMEEIAVETESMWAEKCTNLMCKRTEVLLNTAKRARCDVYGRFANRLTCGVRIAATLPTLAWLRSSNMGAPSGSANLAVEDALAQFRSLAENLQKLSDAILLHASPHDVEDLLSTLEIAKTTIRQPIIVVWHFGAQSLTGENFAAEAPKLVAYERGQAGNHLYCHMLAFERGHELEAVFLERVQHSTEKFTAAMAAARMQLDMAAQEAAAALEGNGGDGDTKKKKKKKKGNAIRSQLTAGYGLQFRGISVAADSVMDVSLSPPAGSGGNQENDDLLRSFQHVLQASDVQNIYMLAPPPPHTNVGGGTAAIDASAAKRLDLAFGNTEEERTKSSSLVCGLCGQKMPSKNALFRHLKSDDTECGRCVCHVACV